MGRTLVVAELSANHGHSLDIALKSVQAAKEAGADAVKIQTYTPDTITLDCNAEDFRVKGTHLWNGRTLYSLYREAYTPWEWHEEIFRVAREEGIICFSTPFDKTAVDFLESFGNPIYKIASFEITDIPLIEYAAKRGKAMVISTGVAMPEDIELAVKTCRDTGNGDITLLKCTSEYPASIKDVNLLTMADMRDRYGVKVGISDHTMGGDVAVAAVALGAEIVEKHFILDRSVGGPDAAFSMQRDEFSAMVKSIRNVEEALGGVHYPADPSEIKGRQFCRSLYVAEDMKAGDIITEQNIRSVRPGYGLHPKNFNEILGKRVGKCVSKGTRFSWDLLE